MCFSIFRMHKGELVWYSSCRFSVSHFCAEFCWSPDLTQQPDKGLICFLIVILNFYINLKIDYKFLLYVSFTSFTSWEIWKCDKWGGNLKSPNMYLTKEVSRSSYDSLENRNSGIGTISEIGSLRFLRTYMFCFTYTRVTYINCGQNRPIKICFQRQRKQTKNIISNYC